MRILVLTSTFPRWAGDREPPFVFELCRRLARAHEVTVIAPHCPGAAIVERFAPGLVARRFRYAPGGLESLAYEGGIPEKLRRGPWRLLLVPFFLLAEWRAARRAIRELAPEVVHAHTVIPHGVVGLLLGFARRHALVCTAHGSDLVSFAVLDPLKARVARSASLLTVVSAALQARAVELGADPGRVRVMPMGVDARERFVPPQAQRSADELLFVGRLVAVKGASVLLRAFAIVRRSVPRARLTIVGSGPGEAELRAEAAALGVGESVAFAGALPHGELPQRYGAAAALVMPSEREGFGLVVAEALACECPVVASDVPGVRELVEPAVTGVLARPGDPADFAEKILGLLRDPVRAQAMARRGRALVLERFDWERVAQGYDEALTAVARPA